MAENELSLSDTFKQVQLSREELDNLEPASDEFKRLLKSCVSLLEQCSRLVDRLVLFSTNEELEDLSTASIQYLGIDYLLADLTLKSYSDTDRKMQLNEASQHLEQFLSRLSEYSLLQAADRRLLDDYKEGRQEFRLVPSSAGLETKRSTKIRRFQEEKQLKSRLKSLRDQTQSLNVDDEVIRSLFLAELDLYVHQTFQSLDLVNQERQILAQMPPKPTSNQAEQSANDDRDRRNGTHINKPYSERLDPSELFNGHRPHRGILDSAGRPLQPFTITNKRTDLTKGVFRSGHNLPTMSIDEYLEEERRRGGIIEGGGPASEQVAEPNEDDIVAQDAATMKAREWDEFVEANPKGAGNTLNRG